MLLDDKEDKVKDLRAEIYGDLCSGQELADALGVSCRTISRFIDRGLPVFKIAGRRWFDRAQAVEWVRTPNRFRDPDMRRALGLDSEVSPR
jgi:hypothetical protein